MSLNPWSEKFRPVTFDDVIGPNVNHLQKLVEDSKTSWPHLLFYGPPGSGKNTAIAILLKKLYQDQYAKKVVFYNASDERGIEMVREKVRNVARYAGTGEDSLPSCIVFDEADMLTEAAQQALRRFMEQYSKTCRFCLLCNYLPNIILPIQSRLKKFFFAPLASADMLQILEKIVRQESVDIKRTELLQIASLCRGDLRRAINLLQTCSFLKESPVSAETINYLSGSLSEQEWCELQSLGTLSQAYEWVEVLYLRGKDLNMLLHKLQVAILFDPQIHFSEIQKIHFLTLLGEIEMEIIQKRSSLPLLQKLIFIFVQFNISKGK